MSTTRISKLFRKKDKPKTKPNSSSRGTSFEDKDYVFLNKPILNSGIVDETTYYDFHVGLQRKNETPVGLDNATTMKSKAGGVESRAARSTQGNHNEAAMGNNRTAKTPEIGRYDNVAAEVKYSNASSPWTRPSLAGVFIQNDATMGSKLPFHSSDHINEICEREFRKNLKQGNVTSAAIERRSSGKSGEANRYIHNSTRALNQNVSIPKVPKKCHSEDSTNIQGENQEYKWRRTLGAFNDADNTTHNALRKESFSDSSDDLDETLQRDFGKKSGIFDQGIVITNPLILAEINSVYDDRRRDGDKYDEVMKAIKQRDSNDADTSQQNYRNLINANETATYNYTGYERRRVSSERSSGDWARSSADDTRFLRCFSNEHAELSPGVFENYPHSFGSSKDPGNHVNNEYIENQEVLHDTNSNVFNEDSFQRAQAVEQDDQRYCTISSVKHTWYKSCKDDVNEEATSRGRNAHRHARRVIHARRADNECTHTSEYCKTCGSQHNHSDHLRRSADHDWWIRDIRKGKSKSTTDISSIDNRRGAMEETCFNVGSCSNMERQHLLRKSQEDIKNNNKTEKTYLFPEKIDRLDVSDKDRRYYVSNELLYDKNKSSFGGMHAHRRLIKTRLDDGLSSVVIRRKDAPIVKLVSSDVSIVVSGSHDTENQLQRPKSADQTKTEDHRILKDDSLSTRFNQTGTCYNNDTGHNRSGDEANCPDSDRYKRAKSEPGRQIAEVNTESKTALRGTGMQVNCVEGYGNTVWGKGGYLKKETTVVQRVESTREQRSVQRYTSISTTKFKKEENIEMRVMQQVESTRKGSTQTQHSVQIHHGSDKVSERVVEIQSEFENNNTQIKETELYDSSSTQCLSTVNVASKEIRHKTIDLASKEMQHNRAISPAIVPNNKPAETQLRQTAADPVSEVDGSSLKDIKLHIESKEDLITELVKNPSPAAHSKDAKSKKQDNVREIHLDKISELLKLTSTRNSPKLKERKLGSKRADVDEKLNKIDDKDYSIDVLKHRANEIKEFIDQVNTVAQYSAELRSKDQVDSCQVRATDTAEVINSNKGRRQMQERQGKRGKKVQKEQQVFQQRQSSREQQNTQQQVLQHQPSKQEEQIAQLQQLGEIRSTIDKLLQGKNLKDNQIRCLALLLWAIDADMPIEVFQRMLKSKTLKLLLAGLLNGTENLVMYNMYST